MTPYPWDHAGGRRSCPTSQHGRRQATSWPARRPSRADKLAGYLDVLACRHSGQSAKGCAGSPCRPSASPEAAALLLGPELREAIYRLVAYADERLSRRRTRTLNAELAVARVQERLAAGTGGR
jgi:hypothetical protein